MVQSRRLTNTTNDSPAIENETVRIDTAMISALDNWVGAVLAELRKQGLEEYTLVIFTGDNGAAEGSDVEGRYNQPLIGHKRNLYEGGIRVPDVLQWKARLEGRQKHEHPVSSLDIFPTLLAAAGSDGLSAYNLDGVDLFPFLEGAQQGLPHDYLFWRSGPNAAVRKGPWKLLLSRDDLTRLYNVAEDPAESRDLSAEQPQLSESCNRPWTGGPGQSTSAGKCAENKNEVQRRSNRAAHLAADPAEGGRLVRLGHPQANPHQPGSLHQVESPGDDAGCGNAGSRWKTVVRRGGLEPPRDCSH